MYRVGLGLGFVWGLRLQINLIYEFIYIYIYIYIYMDFKHYIYSGKSETVYRYPKYIVLLAKPVQPLVRYLLP